ncbi:unnamed protein product [Paramecium sonneborni]|uniref:Uncharacterized protein n=1 Tax=Paramecium sonneborni TaxID=65129 RepID=A0A8S1QFS0_9CILI|nr:unnamed protein product [Paramecium sonneborni]
MLVDNSDSGCSRIIKSQNLILRIIDNGKAVSLEKGNKEFQVTLYEKDANEENSKLIIFKEEDVIYENQLKYNCEPPGQGSTKVLFLKEYKGIAIKWSSGLLSKFEFMIDQ